jgi:hypothetical protein
LPYDKINELVDICILRRSPRGPALLDAMTQSHIRSSGSSPESPSLVGRRAEQELLRNDLAAAREGRGGLVVLSGEAGIGKTSLARDLVGEAIRTGVCVLIGHCYDLTVTPPYGPWLDLAATYRPADGMPVLPDAFATGRIEEIESQAALFADVRSFFAELASIQPVLIVRRADAHAAALSPTAIAAPRDRRPSSGSASAGGSGSAIPGACAPPHAEG